MQRLQAFKFELMPKGGQALDMRRFAGARRFVFNKALDLQQKTGSGLILTVTRQGIYDVQ